MQNNLPSCKTVVKTSPRTAEPVALTLRPGHNDFENVSCLAQDVTRRRSARLRFLALFSIALLLEPVAVPGQSPALFPQTQTKSDQSGSLYGGQAGQQACSPAEFGDP